VVDKPEEESGLLVGALSLSSTLTARFGIGSYIAWKHFQGQTESVDDDRHFARRRTSIDEDTQTITTSLVMKLVAWDLAEDIGSFP
jgi:hypothetical protein